MNVFAANAAELEGLRERNEFAFLKVGTGIIMPLVTHNGDNCCDQAIAVLTLTPAGQLKKLLQ